jgi:hypothetical protein
MQGTRDNAIPRAVFAKLFGEHLLKLDADDCVASIHGNAAYCHKVAPTLVLFPPTAETTNGGLPGMKGSAGSETPADVKTLLRTKTGRTFEEALIKAHGKAILLNFYSPSLEVYPKDKEHCWDIYDKAKTSAAVIPNNALNSSMPLNSSTLAAALIPNLTSAKPPIAGLPGHLKDDISALHRAMVHYKIALGREEPWRLAWNKENARVIAYKLTGDDLAFIVKTLHLSYSAGERLWREESYGNYEFGVGDYVVIDLHEVGQLKHKIKRDGDGHPLVRTVNELAFESTYAKV